MKQLSLNPIIPGFAPDPSVVHVDGHFFLVNSSFHLFPGLPIYASQDLSSWTHIGNAIHRRSQLSLRKSATRLSPASSETDGKVMPGTGGLYAPTIRHHAGTFYIVCTNAVRGVADPHRNFIVSTKDIWKGDWSDPVYFDFEGIDPSITFGDDGKVYMQGCATPGPQTRINNFEIDISTGERLSEERTIWRGTGGVYPEAPHVFKHDGWYHLVIAEGGTHHTHAVTAARSRSIWGPYEADPNNPILTARGTDRYIQHTGHCDVFEDGKGRWWAVCLGVRKAEGRYTMGRETLLTLARWDDGWLKLDYVMSDVVDHSGIRLPGLEMKSEPGVDYVYIRDVSLDKYEFGNDTITLTATSVDFSAPEDSPTFVVKRQRMLEGKTLATVRQFQHEWPASKMKFGVACYKDECRYFNMYFSAADSSVVFKFINKAQNISRGARRMLETGFWEISFCIEYTEREYRLKYSQGTDSSGWVDLATVDTREMTDPDFVGPVLGIFAVADVEEQKVSFEGFRVE